MKRLLVAILAIPALATAQDSTEVRGATNLAEYRLDDPALQGILRGVAPQVTFNFGAEKKTAKAQIGRTILDKSWSFSLAGPVDEKADRTTLATEEGLNAGFNAELTGKRTMHSRRGPPVSARDFDALCRRYGIDPGSVCARQDLPPEGQAAFDAAEWGATWVFGASAKAGRTKFDFAEAATLEDQSRTEAGWSAGAGVGKFFPDYPDWLLYYVGLTLKRESAYSAQNKATLCSPIAGSVTTKCRETSFGEPTRKTKTLVGIESRHFMGTAIAFTPAVTYAADEWTVAVPMFLRQAAEAPFNGGVTLSWGTEKRDLTLGLFVGVMSALR